MALICFTCNTRVLYPNNQISKRCWCNTSKSKREDIPCNLDIFVIHYPPYGVLDDDMGSGEILNFLLHSQPKYHLFGHIHSTAGKEYVFGNTHCVNVGCVDR